MLASLVAEKYTDKMGIDWGELRDQYKEFAGYTGSSLGRIYMKIFSSCLRSKNSGKPSLKEVAEYAAVAYQPGTERKESVAMLAHREKFVLSFKKSVEELGINLVV